MCLLRGTQGLELTINYRLSSASPTLTTKLTTFLVDMTSV